MRFFEKSDKYENQMKTGSRKTISILHDRRIITYSSLAVINSAVMVAMPVLLGCFIDSLVYGGYVLQFFFLLFSAALVNLILNIFLKAIIFKIARQKEQEYQIRLLQAFQILKPSVIDSYRNGEIAMKFFRDAGTAGQFISNIYPQLLNSATGILLAVFIVFYKNPKIAMIIIGFSLPSIISLFPYKKRFSRINHLIRSMCDRSMNGIFEFMHIFPYLKSMSADPPYTACTESKFRKYRFFNSLNDRTSISFEFINRAGLFLGEYSILSAAGWLAWKKMIPVGDIVVFQVRRTGAGSG